MLRRALAACVASLATLGAQAQAQEPDIPEGEPPARPVEEPAVDYGPRTAGSLNLGAGFRYGVAIDDPLVDPWKSGLGLNVGYTTSTALYVGGVFDYFFGETQRVLGTEVSANVWQIAAEVGYDVQFGEGFLLRPKLGAGVSTLNVECEACTTEGSETYFGAGPGVTAMFFFGRVTLSIDGRYQIVFAEPETENALILSAGISF